MIKEKRIKVIPLLLHLFVGLFVLFIYYTNVNRD